MAITSYEDLKDEVAAWLLRDDLTDVIPTFIDNAESALRRDKRVRHLRSTTLTVDAEEETLPDDFVELESIYIATSPNFGELETVAPGQLADFSRRFGVNGIPLAVAVLDNSLRFAPFPDDESFTFEMTYWESIPTLSANLQSNWLLADSPDIYLYASLVESAPYLRDDARITTWRSELERRIAELDLSIANKRWGGQLTRRPVRRIP